MRIRFYSLPCSLLGLFFCSGSLQAQNTTSILVFAPVDVRLSQQSASQNTPATFNSSTLSLSCPDRPFAYLSSAPGSDENTAANLLVDNDLYVTNLTQPSARTNVCDGVVNTTNDNSCFNASYIGPIRSGGLNGRNPDTFVAAYGVPAIDISGFMVAGYAQQLKIELVDEGGFVDSSSIYLNTNCSATGVAGPAVITGNPIPPVPTPPQLNQDFSFNTNNNQIVTFKYDLGPAQTAGTLGIPSGGVIPHVSDAGLDPKNLLTGYPELVSGTSFATSSCLIHDGETLSGKPACKLYTLQCTIGTGNSATGAQCPASTVSNEVLNDIFDGPAFSLSDIPTPNGPTFHEGLGLLMASDSWTGGPCNFAIEADLTNVPCPQNLLVSFTGPGTFTNSGHTTHPNSTFVSIANVPEDLTTVAVTDGSGNPVAPGPGNWFNNSSPHVKFSSQAPNLSGTTLPGAAHFFPSPVETITYGITPGTVAPAVGTTTASDTVLTNASAIPCSTTPPTAISQPAFTPPLQSFSHLLDGNYLVHYVAEDCAGTQELKFLEDAVSGDWSTNFYTYPLNIDTIPPVISTGPALAPAGPYYPGQPVTASFACTDERSGVVACGNKTYPVGVLTTGSTLLTQPVSTTTTGSQTFSVTAVDAAGNRTTGSVPYAVPVDSQIQFSLASNTIVYPMGTTAYITVSPATANGPTPTGTVIIKDGATSVKSLQLSGGSVSYPLTGISSGSHLLYVAYLGDLHDAPGNSAPQSLVVNPLTPGSNLFVVSGTHQTAQIGTAFAQPLVVEVIDKNAQPIAGVTVNFWVPLTGQSAILSANPVVTGADGKASVTATANNLAGIGYTPTATIAGFPKKAEFLLTNTKAPVTSISFTFTNRIYTGYPLGVFYSTVPGNLAVNLSYASTPGTGTPAYGPSPIAPTAIGTYTVTGTVNDQNYMGTAQTTLTIVPHP